MITQYELIDQVHYRCKVLVNIIRQYKHFCDAKRLPVLNGLIENVESIQTTILRNPEFFLIRNNCLQIIKQIDLMLKQIDIAQELAEQE